VAASAEGESCCCESDDCYDLGDVHGIISPPLCAGCVKGNLNQFSGGSTGNRHSGNGVMMSCKLGCLLGKEKAGPNERPGFS
jgi:hypothetical protein